MFYVSVGDINNEDASANGSVVWNPLHGMWGEGPDLPGGGDAVLWAHQGLGRRRNGEDNLDKLTQIKFIITYLEIANASGFNGLI